MTDTKEDYGMAGNGESGDGILIDSSGLPNESHLPVTGVNNHNGIISLEVRVIYVVQQSTGLPLFSGMYLGMSLMPQPSCVQFMN